MLCCGKLDNGVYLLFRCLCCYDYFPYSNSCTTFKHFKKLAPTCFGPYIYGHLQGAHEQCFVQLLSWIRWCTFVMLLHGMRPYFITVGCGCVPGFLSWWNLYDQTSPGQELQAHTHTKPTIMTYDHILHKNITNVYQRIQISNDTKHCSWAPWRWSYIYGPKHVGASF